ncbi:MAG TPA: response regulator [bacterium]|nr:response regulator [bacterium]
MTGVSAPSSAPAEAKRVLVVDDETSIRDLCARVLQRAGFVVTTASGGAEAIQRLQAEPFDAVISDIRMPGLSGLEVLEVAKRAQPAIRVVLITGFGTPQTLERARHSGADRILTKPFNPMELLMAMREILPTP